MCRRNLSTNQGAIQLRTDACSPSATDAPRYRNSLGRILFGIVLVLCLLCRIVYISSHKTRPFLPL